MSKKLSIISLGPGNAELLTIQALRALNESDVILMPTKSQDSWDKSIAYQILDNVRKSYKDWFGNAEAAFNFVESWEDKFIPIYSPMDFSPETWGSQVEQLVEICSKYEKVGYTTLGDAGVFSSAYYLLEIIKEKHPEIYEVTEIIPGITSFSYASSKVKKPLCLGDSKLEIVPTHVENPDSTKVYMRFHRGDDVSIENINDLYYFENLGLEGENFGKGNPDKIKKYLTLIIDFAKNYIPQVPNKEN